MAHPHAYAVPTRHERAKAMIARTGHHLAGGGQVRHLDEAEDAAMISKAMKEHDDQQHGGTHTRLKFKAGGAVEGHEAASHLGRRARGGAAGKKSTHVNVIVAPQAGGMRPPMPVPVPGAAPPIAAAMPPPRPPVVPPGAAIMPPSAGMRPPGMKRGGGVKKVVEAGTPSENLMQARRGGGVPHMEAGAGGAEGRIEKMHEYGEGGFKPKEHPGEFQLRDRATGRFAGGRV